MSATPIVQIMPPVVAGHSGVADYARILGAKLSETTGRESLIGGAELLGGHAATDVILHYVNYGYDRRGLPNQLLSQVRRWRATADTRLLVIFHETYASGPWWKSAFWLSPLQKRLARAIAQLSDHCIVSNEIALSQLQRLTPGLSAEVHPTFSNFGEPQLTPEDIAGRDPHRWVICGGTALIERSLRSFAGIYQRIPADCSPRELIVFGGEESETVRALIARLSSIAVEYRPTVQADEGSHLLAQAGFAWIDYFATPGVAPGVILKSGVFAACCAHAVVAVLPYGGAPLSLGQQPIPGPFFVDQSAHNLPAAACRAEVATKLYQFYQRFVAAELLARKVARAL